MNRERWRGGEQVFPLPTYAHYVSECEGGQSRQEMSVRVCFLCWSEHTGAEVLNFYLKTLYFWHTLHLNKPDSFPTD